ncbi:unnamed protein product [Lactuca virosa]|uniref:PGG domain-containing protein n=1 Tax=Lactuca virosa TaxID=75947 RepID=A0AAU9P0M9_9ASTR|nr:unnamed protein product [Lactuca virosa]
MCVSLTSFYSHPSGFMIETQKEKIFASIEMNTSRESSEEFDKAGLDLFKASTKAAKVILDKHEGNDGKLSLQMADFCGPFDMLANLQGKSERMKGSTEESRGGVLLACVEAELFDVAQQIVKDCPELAVSERIILRILAILARKPHAFGKKYNPIQKYIYQYDANDGHVDEGNQAVQLLRTILPNIPKHELDDMPSGSLYQIMEGISSSSVLFVAAELGNTVFVNELIHHYPQLVVELNDNKQSIFHIAVLNRHLGIYNLLHGIGSIKDSIINLEDKNGNNLLHFVGIRKEPLMDSQSQYLQGPAVHMERERQWFKMVSDMLPPSLREKKNKADLRPRELFTKNHKELLSKAVDSVEKTSLELMVVASAIAIISCVIDIAFVGRYGKDTGKSTFMFHQKNWSIIWNDFSIPTQFRSALPRHLSEDPTPYANNLYRGLLSISPSLQLVTPRFLIQTTASHVDGISYWDLKYAYL